MPFAENLLEGLASAAGDKTTVQRIEKRKDERKELSDEQRQLQAKNYTAIKNNIAQLLANGVDPHDPTKPLSPEQKQHLESASATVDRALQGLFTPQEEQSPIRTLTDKLHVTKPRPAARQMGDLKGIQAEFGALPEQAQGKPELWMKGPDGKVVPARIVGGKAVPFQMPPDMTAVAAPSAPKGGGSDFARFLASRADELGMEPSELSTEQIDAARREWMGAGRTDKEDFVYDSQSSTGVSKRTRDANGKITGYARDVIPPRQAIITETVTTDPFGVTSTSIRKPVYSGAKAITEGQTGTKGTPKPAGEQKKDLQGITTKSPTGKQLDEQGHIPVTAKANRYLIEAANNLMDGMDVTKLPIPARDRAAAEELARSYGWKGQGLFAPGDLMRVRNSLGIINEFDKPGVMDVLDDGVSRQKIAQALEDIEKRGTFGKAAQTYIASKLTPAEQHFVDVYLQAVGRISGLSQLVRSGRPTEATINRLKSELPNPGYTGSSAAGRNKLKLLHNEIDIAMDKGQFLETPPTTTPTSGTIVVSPQDMK